MSRVKKQKKKESKKEHLQEVPNDVLKKHNLILLYRFHLKKWTKIQAGICEKFKE